MCMWKFKCKLMYQFGRIDVDPWSKSRLMYGLMNTTANIIVWAHLIQGIKLLIVLRGPIAGGTTEMRMACMGPLESQWYRKGHFLMRHCTLEWLVLAFVREYGHMTILSYGPICSGGANCRWYRFGHLFMGQWTHEWLALAHLIQSTKCWWYREDELLVGQSRCECIV